MQEDLNRAYAEASHYILVGQSNFRVCVGNIEISSFELPKNAPKYINRHEVKKLCKKVNKIFRRQNEETNDL